MTRQKPLNEWILGNTNLWLGTRSLIVGHSVKLFFRQIKERRKNMQQTVYNPQKADWKQLMSILRMRTQHGLTNAKIAMGSSR
jgi:hypothetical protein